MVSLPSEFGKLSMKRGKSQIEGTELPCVEQRKNDCRGSFGRRNHRCFSPPVAVWTFMRRCLPYVCEACHATLLIPKTEALRGQTVLASTLSLGKALLAGMDCAGIFLHLTAPLLKAPGRGPPAELVFQDIIWYKVTGKFYDF
jgi:hypothetical protein